jgi:hypothetical protein
LGYGITRSAIANTELGRRDTVPVQRVTGMAMTLDTSLVVLPFGPAAPATDLGGLADLPMATGARIGPDR